MLGAVQASGTGNIDPCGTMVQSTLNECAPAGLNNAERRAKSGLQGLEYLYVAEPSHVTWSKINRPQVRWKHGFW